MKNILVFCTSLPANGMAIFPFIILKERAMASNPILINHEKIHIKQQLELLILPFYIIHLFHYVVNLIIYQNHYKAYLNILFEKEAYRNEEDLDYLKKRRFFAWMFKKSSNKR